MFRIAALWAVWASLALVTLVLAPLAAGSAHACVAGCPHCAPADATLPDAGGCQCCEVAEAPAADGPTAGRGCACPTVAGSTQPPAARAASAHRVALTVSAAPLTAAPAPPAGAQGSGRIREERGPPGDLGLRTTILRQ